MHFISEDSGLISISVKITNPVSTDFTVTVTTTDGTATGKF